MQIANHLPIFRSANITLFTIKIVVCEVSRKREITKITCSKYLIQSSQILRQSTPGLQVHATTCTASYNVMRSCQHRTTCRTISVLLTRRVNNIFTVLLRVVKVMQTVKTIHPCRASMNQTVVKCRIVTICISELAFRLLRILRTRFLRTRFLRLRQASIPVMTAVLTLVFDFHR